MEEKWFPNVMHIDLWISLTYTFLKWNLSSTMPHKTFTSSWRGRSFRQPNSIHTDLTEAIQPSHTHCTLLALRSASCTQAYLWPDCVRIQFFLWQSWVEKFIAVHFHTRHSQHLLQSWSSATSRLRCCEPEYFIKLKKCIIHTEWHT